MAQSSLNRWKYDPEYTDLLNYFIEITKDAKSPINVSKSVVDFKEKSGNSQNMTCLDHRIRRMRTIIHSFEHIDTETKVKLLFALGAPVDAGFLKQLKKSARVEVDNKKRITKYEAKDGSLRLQKDQNRSARLKTTKLAPKRSLRSSGNRWSDPKKEEVKEMGNLMKFIKEKCENVETPLNISLLTEDFNKKYGISRSLLCIQTRITSYCREIQKTELLDTDSTVKQLFGLSAKLELDYLEKLRKDAVVEVDDQNRITKYTANNGRLILNRDPSSSAKKSMDCVGRRKSKNTVEKQCNFGGDEESDHLDETKKLTKPSNGAVVFDNKTPTKNQSEMSTDSNFDFDPPTGKSHGSEEIEARGVIGKENHTGITENAVVKTRKFENLPKNKTSSSTSHTPETPKRKSDASDGSSSSKRSRIRSDEFKPEETNDNFSQDDPSRVKLEPSRGPLELPKEIEKDAGIQQIPKPRPQVIKAPIKQEYAVEAQTSLKTVLKSFKSLILGLETTGLSHFLMELDKKIIKTGRGVEISNKEVNMAMDFFIVKLSKHGAMKSSEEAFSLHDILLILRTIILNSSFKGLEDILKMLKENIDQLKDLDKKVPVSKVDSVLRATIDSIST